MYSLVRSEASERPSKEIINQPRTQVVGEFDSHWRAELAIQQLSKIHIDVRNLTIIGTDYHSEESPMGYINTGDRMLAWGKAGAFWGSIWGVLAGSAVIVVPGVGSILLAGWIVQTLLTGVEGAVLGGGLAAVAAALSSIGIPHDSVIRYETAIKAGRYLVIARGDPGEVARCQSILMSLGAAGLEVGPHGTPTLASSVPDDQPILPLS